MKRFALLLFPLGVISLSFVSSADADDRIMAANRSKRIEMQQHEKESQAAFAVPRSEAVPELITRDQAIRLAEQHLTLRNNRWGNPVDVRDGEDEYLVVYDTPVQETRLIGKRAVTVDKETGLVHMRERR